MPGLSYAVDNTWGFPSAVVNIYGSLTGPRAGDPLTIAKNYILEKAQFFNVTAADLANLRITDNITWPIGNAKIVYFTQTHNGIPLAGGVSSAGLKADGSISIINSNLISNIGSQVNATTPGISAQQAILAAAQDAGIVVNGGLTSTTPRGVEQVPTYINTSISVDPIPVKLQYMPIAPGHVRLVYNTRIFIPGTTYQFEYNIDAVSGQVYNRQNLIAGDSYRVFKSPNATPAEGGRVMVSNPADPVASPWGWHDTNGRTGAEYNITRGNNVFAKYGPLADPGDDDIGTPGPSAPQSGAGNVYDWPVDLRFNPETYWQASTTNLFYAMNYYHDVLYRAGFTESTGNFQQNNYGKTAAARQGDYILGVAQSGWQLGNFNNAFFVSAPDGQIGRMAMFQWNITGVKRDGDFDTNIVYHELTHGTANRMVGGSAQSTSCPASSSRVASARAGLMHWASSSI